MGIYANTGTIEGGLGFAYTGVKDGDHFQIRLPAAGGRVDGITFASVPSDSSSAVAPADLRYPQTVQLSSNVTAGDQLSCGADGRFRVRAATEEQSGAALENGTTNGNASVLYHSQVFSRQGTGIAKRLEPYGSVCAVNTNFNVATLTGLPVSIGGVTVSAPGLQVLLAGQTNTAENGPWLSVSSGAWTQLSPVEAATSERPAVVLVSVGTLARSVCQSTDWTAAGVASTWTVSPLTLPAGVDPAKLGNGDVDATELSALNGISGSIQGRLAALEALAGVPVGTIMIWGNAAAPTGWSILDGADYLRSAPLWDVFGTTFGPGNGTTTASLPDFRQRFPLGQATSGTGSTLGGTGGAIDHDHGSPLTTGTPSATVAATNLTGSAASTTHTHSVTVPGDNPPFLAINFIVKT